MHTHAHRCFFNGHFPGNQGLAKLLILSLVILTLGMFVGQAETLPTHMVLRARALIVAAWADRFSWCCWRRFLQFLACPITLHPVPASHCLSSLLHTVTAV